MKSELTNSKDFMSQAATLKCTALEKKSLPRTKSAASHCKKVTHTNHLDTNLKFV